MGNIFSEFMGKAEKLLQDIGTAATKPVDERKLDILTAEKLTQLKWLSSAQLAAIYKYGKVKVKIDDNPAAYAQLKWFTSEQLKAIFGEEDL
jgi:hypothetical protein